MAWLEPMLLAQIHREVYVAILRSWIPHGERGDFARRVGVTREYLSYLCALDRASAGGSITRLPHPQTAKRIADVLPAPPEIKISLLENMLLARERHAEAHYVLREWMAQRLVGELLQEIERFHRQATFGGEAAHTQRAYRMVRDASFNLLTHLSPQYFPPAYAQICLYLHDAQCVLDRADDALRYAKLARLVLENSDEPAPGFDRPAVDNLYINAVRGEMIAYHNLGLRREMPRLFEEARSTSAFRNAGQFWKPLVGRDMLNSMARTPRFSIRAARRLANEIQGICEQKGDGFTLLLVRESYARCLIQQAEWKQASRVIREELERLPALPHYGPLHHSLLLKSSAQAAWEQGDQEQWKQQMGLAVALMQQAGLKHQLRELQQFYGNDNFALFQESAKSGDSF